MHERQKRTMRCIWHSELRVRSGSRGSLPDDKKSRCSVISSLPCPIDRSLKVLSGDNSYGQGPTLNSLRKTNNFLMSLGVSIAFKSK